MSQPVVNEGRTTASGEPEYWEAVNVSWQASQGQALWRAHSDVVHSSLLADWLPTHPVEALLKTDSFDEAAGTGLYPLLAARAARIIMIDLAHRALKAAHRRYGDTLAAGADVRCLPFPGDTFDVIVSNSTLDHFEGAGDTAAALRELHRVLRPGAELLLTLDNLANPIVALRNALPFGVTHRLGLVPYQMGWTCGPQRLRRLLVDAGFWVEEMRAILHCPRAPAVAVASMLQRFASAKIQAGFLSVLIAFERLARCPTRFVSGYFVAVKARKTENAH